MGKRIGILGGTFDPIHLGHCAGAIEVAEAFSLDVVLLMVSARPPHKGELASASASHRLAMVNLAASCDPRLIADDLEVKAERPSWTAETLKELARRYEDDDSLWFIAGIDAWREVDSWYCPETLLDLANIIVTSRPGTALGDDEPRPPFAASQDACYDREVGGYVSKSGHKLIGHRIEGVEAASFDIRRRIAEGWDSEELIDPLVASYIKKHNLYLNPN